LLCRIEAQRTKAGQPKPRNTRSQEKSPGDNLRAFAF
jgi:hypothetical protein